MSKVVVLPKKVLNLLEKTRKSAKFVRFIFPFCYNCQYKCRKKKRRQPKSGCPAQKYILTMYCFPFQA